MGRNLRQRLGELSIFSELRNKYQHHDTRPANKGGRLV